MLIPMRPLRPVPFPTCRIRRICTRPSLRPVALGLTLLAGWSLPALAQSTPAPPPAAAAEQDTNTPPTDTPSRLRPRPRPPELEAGDRRCTADGTHCIATATYIPDVCRTIEAVARANAIDPGFFLRLIWQESRFDAAAISPAGARGIAQFMPGTADLRGLKDPFNPAEALSASAAYLAELSHSLGNFGLAAVAYNGGEARAARFIGGADGLPLETRAYVYTITGRSALTWRDAPPELAPPAALSEGDFQATCLDRARGLPAPAFRQPLPPWGVVLGSSPSRGGIERQAERLFTRYAPVLEQETPVFSVGRTPGMRHARHLAQIGRDSRKEAVLLCDHLRSLGGACLVMRN